MTIKYELLQKERDAWFAKCRSLQAQLDAHAPELERVYAQDQQRHDAAQRAAAELVMLLQPAEVEQVAQAARVRMLADRGISDAPTLLPPVEWSDPLD